MTALRSCWASRRLRSDASKPSQVSPSDRNAQPFGCEQILGRQPAGCVVLDVVEVHRPKGSVDADPGEERNPAIPLVGLDRLVGVLVDVDLVVERSSLRSAVAGCA